MRNSLLLFATFSGLFCVAFGAWSSHQLASSVSDIAMSWIDKGIKYQMFHTATLLALGLFLGLCQQLDKLNIQAQRFYWSGYAWMLGILLFSGSLYLLAITGNRSLVWLTPIGGVSLMVGWGILVITVLSSSKKVSHKE